MGNGQASMRVLVVDGRHYAAAMLASFLYQCGHHAYILETGEAALRKAPIFDPDLMFVNAALPPLDGVSLARQLRRVPELAATPLIAVNEDAEAISRGAAVELGFDDLLTSPYTLDDLSAVIARVRSRVPATGNRATPSQHTAEQAGSRADVMGQELDAWWFQRRDVPTCLVSFLGCEDKLVDHVGLTFASANVRLAKIGSPEQALVALEAEPMDLYHCLVVDAVAANLDAEALVNEASPRQARLPIIFLVAPGDLTGAVRLMRAGACDVIERSAPAELAEAVRLAFYGLHWRAAHAIKPRTADGLTERERQLLELTAKGLLNKQIAREMNVSMRTVCLRRAALMNKLEVGSRAELIRRAIEWELVPT